MGFTHLESEIRVIQQFLSRMPLLDDKHDDTKTMKSNGTAERFNYVQQEVHHLRAHKPE